MNDELKAYLIGFDPMDEWYFAWATEVVSEGMQTTALAFRSAGQCATELNDLLIRLASWLNGSQEDANADH
jgi:hypothetical protein